MNRRPHPGPEPSLGAWLIVAGAFFRALGEVADSAVRILFFPFVRERWRRQIAARVAAGALPPAASGTVETADEPMKRSATAPANSSPNAAVEGGPLSRSRPVLPREDLDGRTSTE